MTLNDLAGDSGMGENCWLPPNLNAKVMAKHKKGDFNNV